MTGAISAFIWVFHFSLSWRDTYLYFRFVFSSYILVLTKSCWSGVSYFQILFQRADVCEEASVTDNGMFCMLAYSVIILF